MVRDNQTHPSMNCWTAKRTGTAKSGRCFFSVTYLDAARVAPVRSAEAPKLAAAEKHIGKLEKGLR